MPKCLVVFCKNRRGESEGVNFYSLTKERYQPWMKALGRNPIDKVAINSNAVCSEHFTEDSFSFINNKKVLKNFAIPTLKLKPKRCNIFHGDDLKQGLSFKMETGAAFTCRLCLKICSDGFEVIDDTIQEMMHFLLLNLDLGISNEPVLCNSCVDNLKECRNFKVGYLYKEDIKKFSFNDVRPNSRKTCLCEKEHAANASCSSSSSTCYFCMDVGNGETPVFIKNKDADVTAMLEKYCPELVSNITDDFATCISCHNALQNYFTSMTNWLSVEEKIKVYCKVEGTNNKGQIELSSVLQFISKSLLSVENTYSNLNVIKTEEVFLERMKNEDVETVVNNEDFVGTEKEELDFSDNSISIKIEENDYDSYKDDLLSIPQLENKPVQTTKNTEVKKKPKCEVCLFEFKRRSSLLSHMRLHKSSSEVMMYTCDTCGYRTRHKHNLQGHLLTHRNNSEVTMYKCEICAHQTRHKSGLQVHMLVHKNATETMMYKCNICEFESKHKGALQTHELRHKSDSELTMYRCNNCSFQGKRKTYLRKHMLTHKSTSEIMLYECELCVFKTKHRKSLARHMLTHKDRSEITMHKCEFCPFLTKYKDNLHKHEKSHRSTSEVTTHQE